MLAALSFIRVVSSLDAVVPFVKISLKNKSTKRKIYIDV